MTLARIRVDRTTLVSGAFAWARPDANGQALASGRASLDAVPFSGACEVVIASDMIVLDRVAVPAAQQRRLGSALRFLAEERAIQDPERLHVAAAPASGKEFLDIAIIEREWLERLIGKLAHAGLMPRAAYPECLLPDLAPDAWTVVWSDEASFARTGEFAGFALDNDAAGEVPAALRLALQNARAQDAAPHRIVVRLGEHAAAPDVQGWSAVLGVQVQLGAPWRWFAAERPPRLDLLQGEFAPHSGREWLQRLRRPALLASALVVLTSLGIAADWAAKAGERKRLTAQMQAIYRETFGEAATIVDAPLQMSRALADARARAGETAASDFHPLLDKVAAGWLDPERQRIDSISYARGTLTVVLHARDASQSAALLERLRARAPVPGLALRIDPQEAGRSIRLTASAP